MFTGPVPHGGREAILAGGTAQQGTSNRAVFWSALMKTSSEEELVVDVKVRGSLDCSDDAVFELRIQRGGSNAKSMTTALDFRRAESGLFRGSA